jgi:hypothetical protein
MQDFLLDETSDLRIENGDFAIGDATLQHQNHILLAQKGEFKNVPEIGAGVLNAINSENPRELLTEIRRNFEYDGMKVNTLKVDADGKLIIDATYN